MPNKISSVRGMRDILPKEQFYWKKILKTVDKIADDFDFVKMETPIVESSDLFKRTVGEGTDIVEKEMFSFETKGKDKVVLRPEFTASIARAFIENGMSRWPKPVKIYTYGSLFRYERPQEGRYREHHQLDFEIFGRKDPLLDVQVISLALLLLKKVGIKKKLKLAINSIGCMDCRKTYRKSLIGFLKSEKRNLCGDCKIRLKKNPLRVLDCKENKCHPVVRMAPKITEFLCEDCNKHFKQVIKGLEQMEISYKINPSLVRGLDYYNRTVFEIAQEVNGERGLALLGGGRYDGLVSQLGGDEIGGIGFGSGIERLVQELMKQPLKKEELQKNKPVFLIGLGDLGKLRALKLLFDLEQAGIKATESLGRHSIKAQLKIASKLKAKAALIVGQKEALDKTVIIRDLTVGSQETILENKVVERLKRILKA